MNEEIYKKINIDEPNPIEEEDGKKNGQTKCPKCGSTDIHTNLKNGKLRCSFCRFEFDGDKAFNDDDIFNLEGVQYGDRTHDIESSEDLITLKCQSCGSEIVVDTSSHLNARCHWCRSILSINEKVPNGAVPDVILPFSVSKENASQKIDQFVKERSFFAHNQFKKEFSSENIMGVYFPYMLVDVNAKFDLYGTGEILKRKYYVKRGKTAEARYDADAYKIRRRFDIAIDDLTIESKKDRMNMLLEDRTNNVINAILPFDTENSVKFDANFMRGFTSEKRDANISDLNEAIDNKTIEVAKDAAKSTTNQYDRGVLWEGETHKIKGQSWNSAYLPVWMYSFMEKRSDKNIHHYVALNARTQEVMGSVPINYPKLWVVSILIELFGGYVALTLDTDSIYKWLLLLPGIAFFVYMESKYRNKEARDVYEKETKRQIKDVETEDRFFEERRGLYSPTISDKNF